MVALNSTTLATIGERLPAPNYDRSAVSTGIVHFGVGNFHRAHQAMYVDSLMNSGEAMDWGICGVGVLPSDARMRDVLTAQDGLYTLVLRHSDGRLEPRVIGSMVEYLFAPDDPEAVIRKLSDPATRIVSLTVTEGGYNNHPVTGQFDLGNEQVVADAHSSSPETVFGLVTAALQRRRAAALPPFTVMSCDNIQENGHVAKAAFVAFARLIDDELANWIDDVVPFPSSMVDRITPVTTDTDRELVATEFGIDDGWPVLCEPFQQWVLEDTFAGGRPPVEKVGVQVVQDVSPYEHMKLRLLNASHQAMAYFGYLAGYRFAHEAATDPTIRAFLRAYMDSEATPTLPAVPGIDLEAYKQELIERFSNPEVRDTLARLCADSSNRIPKWLLPVVTDNLASGGDVRLSAAIVASWARYAEGVDENGKAIVVVDRLADTLTRRALGYDQDELVFLRDPELFGDLVGDARFVDAYRTALRQLHQRGALATLQSALHDVSTRDLLDISPPEIDGAWVRPSAAFPSEPRWGHADGIQVGLHPLPGPRGLLRIYAPYLGHSRDRLVNFIAVEPIPSGVSERGYSELEPSRLDDAPGKRFWSADSPDDATPLPGDRPARGVVETIDGVEHLRVFVMVEPFDNGADVFVRVSFRADRPHEVGVAAYCRDRSVPLDYCVLSATMGNFARLRQLHLVDRIVTPGELWPDFDGLHFAPHVRFPVAELARNDNGDAVVSATTDEAEPQNAEYAADTRENWKYYGKRATQTWRAETPDARLEALMNARGTYWASSSLIPGGPSYENFELVEPFAQGREFFFSINPVD